MNNARTLEEWKALVAQAPDLGNQIWHDPDSAWIEAREHNTWLQMVIIMPGFLSNSDEEQLQIIRLLLDSGADPNRKNDFGYTALHFACAIDYRNAEIAEILMNYGADPGALANNHKTPMDLLGTNQESDVIRQMLEKPRD